MGTLVNARRRYSLLRMVTCGIQVDGDVLNVIRMITVELKRAFGEIFFPRTGFMVDRNTGLFNGDFGLIKDQRISLYRWATI